MKRLFLLVVILTFISCIKDKKKAVINTLEVISFDVKKLPPKAIANATALSILKQWTEYNALETSFVALYNVSNEEGLSVVLDNLIENQKLLKTSKYPEIFNDSRIKSRQMVFKTYVLKTKASLTYKIDNLTPTIEMVNAYNALVNQFSINVGDTIKTELLLEEFSK